MAETAPKRGRRGDHSTSSSRIIRVSHATGGKDRHCKVLTTRGPRDRRVRLSVPTAVQLYDLQDRLGLDQPSKAVDWLIAAAAAAIAHLPSLPAIEFSPTSGTGKGPDISPSQSEIHLATPTADYFGSPGLDRGLEREALQSNAESYLAQCGHYHYHCHHHHLPTVSSTLPLLFGSSEEYQLPGRFDGRLQLCHGEGNWRRSFVMRGEGEE